MGFLCQSIFALFVLTNIVLSQDIAAFKVHETVASVPNGWIYVEPAEDPIITDLSIALRQPELRSLRARLDLISNPNHQDFGAHLSKDQLRLFQQPSNTSIESVLNWLENHGVEDFRYDSAWVHFNTTVSTINSLLDCRLSKYKNDASQIVYRAMEYSLPSYLSEMVDFVFPITQFIGKPKRGAIERHEIGRGIEQRQSARKYRFPWFSP